MKDHLIAAKVRSGYILYRGTEYQTGPLFRGHVYRGCGENLKAVKRHLKHKHSEDVYACNRMELDQTILEVRSQALVAPYAMYMLNHSVKGRVCYHCTHRAIRELENDPYIKQHPKFLEHLYQAESDDDNDDDDAAEPPQIEPVAK